MQQAVAFEVEIKSPCFQSSKSPAQIRLESRTEEERSPKTTDQLQSDLENAAVNRQVERKYLQHPGSAITRQKSMRAPAAIYSKSMCMQVLVAVGSNDRQTDLGVCSDVFAGKSGKVGQRIRQGKGRLCTDYGGIPGADKPEGSRN